MKIIALGRHAKWIMHVMQRHAGGWRCETYCLEPVSDDPRVVYAHVKVSGISPATSAYKLPSYVVSEIMKSETDESDEYVIARVP